MADPVSRQASPASLDALLARADLWRGDRLAASDRPAIPTGFAELDAVLPGGGWPGGTLVEILVAGARRGPGGVAGAGELSLLLPVCVRQTRAGGWLAMVAPPGVLYAPALAAAGVDLSRLIVVEPDGPADRLWAVGHALRSGAVDSVLAWLPQVEAPALRRLQLAAEAGGATLFAFRPQACAAQASPAPLRLAVTGEAAGASVRVLKRRGPPLVAALGVPVVRPLTRPLDTHSDAVATNPSDALARPPLSRPAAGCAAFPSAA